MAAKRSDLTIRVETWVRDKGTDKPRSITKVAVRHANGQFHGATNYRMLVGDKPEYR